MVRFLLVIWLTASLASSQTKAQVDVRPALSRAEALYYDANYQQVIDLLSPVAVALQSEPNREGDKISIQLYLAQAYVGLNRTSEAKEHFEAIAALDPSYALNPRQYSSKILSLFADAKAEVQCTTFCKATSQAIDNGDYKPLLERLSAGGKQCACVLALASDTTDHLYSQGLAAYEKDDFPGALDKFRILLQFEPDHKLAIEYSDLARAQLSLTADRIFLQWQHNIEAGAFEEAASTYRELLSIKGDEGVSPRLVQARTHYQAMVPQLYDEWAKACQGGNAAAMDRLRKQARALPADVIPTEEVLGRLKCAQRGCVRLDATAVMPHLTRRVEPRISPNLQRVVEKSGPLTVYVQAKISEEGAVSVIETQGIDPGIRESVRTAVKDWKFSPTTVEDEARCVDTILSVVVKR
jgi:tetratricopeptide (TPR) repeat protein